MREIVSEEVHKLNAQCSTMKIDQASIYLGISDDVIRKQCKLPEGNSLRIPHSRIGTQYIFRKESLDAWLDAQEGFVLKSNVVNLPQKSKEDKHQLIELITKNLVKLVEA